MKGHARWMAAAFGVAGLATGCIALPAGTGRFERTLSVTGPVRLELQNGSGSVHVTSGPPGQVRILGELQVRALAWQNARRRVEEIAANPPIEQNGNVIRVGYDRILMRSVRVDYTITVPEETELKAGVGSGSMEVRGIRGPVSLSTGSGAVAVEAVREDAELTTGSGRVEAKDIGGAVRANSGSGRLTLSNIRGDIRANTGSGGITIEEPGGRITTEAGSGSTTVRGATADLRVSTGSGGLNIEGNPSANSYWELETGSGGVEIRVAENAGFRLHAQTHSGRITTRLPIVIEEQNRREIRGRIGSGEARLEVRTGSGGIQIY